MRSRERDPRRVLNLHSWWRGEDQSVWTPSGIIRQLSTNWVRAYLEELSQERCSSFQKTLRCRYSCRVCSDNASFLKMCFLYHCYLCRVCVRRLLLVIEVQALWLFATSKHKVRIQDQNAARHFVTQSRVLMAQWLWHRLFGRKHTGGSFKSEWYLVLHS